MENENAQMRNNGHMEKFLFPFTFPFFMIPFPFQFSFYFPISRDRRAGPPFSFGVVQMGASFFRPPSRAAVPFCVRKTGGGGPFCAWPFCKMRDGLGFRGHGFGFDHHMWYLSAHVRLCKCIRRNALTHSPSRNLPSAGFAPGLVVLQSGRITR